MVEPRPSAPPIYEDTPPTVEEWGTPLPIETTPSNRTQASYPSLSDLERLAVTGGM